MKLLAIGHCYQSVAGLCQAPFTQKKLASLLVGLSSNLPPGLSSVLGETLIWKDLDGILDLSWGLGVNLTLILRDCRASVEVYALFGII